MSAEITSDRTFMVFVVIVVVGGVAGFVLGLLWWRTRQDVGEIILRIKKRIPSEDDERIEQDPEANA
jgi:hypothetical protein